MREGAKRAAVTLVIFLLLASGTVLAAGVTDTSRLPAGPLPARFALAEPRVGDTATYTWARIQVADDGAAAVVNEHEAIGFEWLPPSRESDGDGIRRDALMLHQWGWQPEDSGVDPASVPADAWERYAEPVFALEVGTDRVLSYAYLSDATANPDRQDPQRARTVQRMFVDGDDGFAPRCGAFPAFGGREVPLDRGVDLFRACAGFVNQMSVSPHTPVKAVGTQTLGDHETVLFSAHDETLHVWYNASIPMPLRIATRSCSWGLFGLDCPDGVYDVLRHTTFRRGDAALPVDAGARAERDAAPEWAMAPLVGGLPDERGVEHAFPASEALSVARSHQNGSTFAAVLARGGLTFLRFHEYADEYTESSTWEMTAYDGDRSASVSVARRTDRTTAPAGPLPLPPLSPAPSSSVRTWDEVASTDVIDPNPQPHPDLLPRTAPTVASMWARWRAFASESYASAAPNAWGFRVGCIPDHDGTCTVFVERFAGVSRHSSGEWLQSELAESDHGGRGHEMTLREQWYAGPTGGDRPETRVQTSPARGQLTVIRSTAWIAPATPVVVGSAVTAALVSLGYLFWPALRFGAVALYTRNATPPDALEHPQRRRMMEVIRADPGIQVPALAKALDRRRSPTEHHLAMLERVGLVRVVREGSRRRVFACDADPNAHASPAVLDSEVARRILDARRADPAISVRDAARALGVSPGTVSYHLARLRASQLLPPAPSTRT